MPLRTPEKSNFDDNPNRIQNSYDAYSGSFNSPSKIKELEDNFANNPDANDIDAINDHANNPANSTKNSWTGKPTNTSTSNIDAVKDREANAGWQSNFTGKGANPTTKFNLKGFAKKKGPAGAIIALLLGGGVIGGGLIGPGLALVHFKEVLTNKVDTQASVISQRSTMLTRARIFGGTNAGVRGKCTTGGIKIACRYTSMSEDQFKKLKENNLKLTDKNHKEITPDKKGRYSGAKYIESTDGSFKPIKASQYRVAVDTKPVFRNAIQGVYPSKWNSLKDKVGTKFFNKNKLTEDPKWTSKDSGGDEKTNRKQINKNLRENATGGADMSDLEKSKFGKFAGPIDKEKSTINSSTNIGKDVTLNSAPDKVLAMPRADVGKFAKLKAFSSAAANPFSTINGACTAYNYERAVVTLAKVPATVQEMRFAAQFLSTADKIKAGAAAPNDVSSAMNILEKENRFGNSFGDSTAYHWAEYNKPTNAPIEAGITGTALLTFMSNNVRYVNKYIKHMKVGIPGTPLKKGFCSATVQTSLAVFGTVASVIANIFTGGGASAAEIGADEAAQQGTKALIKTLVSDMKKKITDSVAKDALKDSVKNASKRIGKEGAKFTGIFLAMEFIGRYFVPYVAHLATGTLYTGDMDGVAAADTIAAGDGAINAGVSQGRGMTTMSKDQTQAFLDFNQKKTNEYIAYERSKANPLDANNPYSVSNAVGVAIYSSLADINFVHSPSSLLSLPSHVMSSIVSPLSLTASAASSKDRQALLNSCEDTDATQNGTIATDPFCNAIYGFDNMNMLKNTQPDDVLAYMMQNKYVDNNGDPVAGTKFGDYTAQCFGDATDGKVISSVVDEGQQLPEECYKKPGDLSQYQYDMFHLYYIDQGIASQMDTPYDVNNSDGSSNSPPSSSPTTASAQELAKEILKNNNISYVYDAKQDLTLASQGKPGTCNTPIDPRLLAVANDIGQNHKLIISAIESHCTGHMKGSDHYRGKAIDFASIDGAVAYKKIASVWPDFSKDARGAFFLQRQCGGGPTPSGMKWLSGDTCTHIHMSLQAG